MELSRERRREIIAALRKGTVPQRGLDFFAVGLGRFESVISEELADVGQGAAAFKAVRGDYGCGKTFFGRWVQEHAKKKGFATAEVQIARSGWWRVHQTRPPSRDTTTCQIGPTASSSTSTTVRRSSMLVARMRLVVRSP